MLLKGAPARKTGTRPFAQPAEVDVEPRRPLVCAQCGSHVTWEDRRIQISGRHAHTEINPHGIEFHFGCFSDAEGCAVHGEPTDEHTWFPGCAWQFAHCRGCGTHLGWYFTGAETFFGLVLDRLAAAPPRGLQN